MPDKGFHVEWVRFIVKRVALLFPVAILIIGLPIALVCDLLSMPYG